MVKNISLKVLWGAVVLDSTGTLCVATSTGGLTNKLSGRIGDTPTIGAGFFAEEWTSNIFNPDITCCSPISDTVISCSTRQRLHTRSIGLHASANTYTPKKEESQKCESSSSVRHWQWRLFSTDIRCSNSRSYGTFSRLLALDHQPDLTIRYRYRTLSRKLQVLAACFNKALKIAGMRLVRERAGLLVLTSPMERARSCSTSTVVGCSMLGFDDEGRDRFQLYHQ